MRSSQTPEQKSAALADAEREISDRAKDDPIVPDVRAPRACKGCGFVRTVLVRTRREADYSAGLLDRYGTPRPTFKNTGESYESHCTACKLEANARKYERLADQNRARAVKARSAQAMRRLASFAEKARK